ncbi:hypothetical protein SDC9_135261 [bioreactor metagenome]|uniref:Uncharacterized protein n=1 Tax=bioreactor metagenome TaxID=1076179 RepID=A0A645DFA2_9ZZZZ
MCFQRKGGKRGEAAANADLEKQHRAGIKRGGFSGYRHDETEQKRPEHIDTERDERETALMPQGHKTHKIAQHRADQPAEANENTVENHCRNSILQIVFLRRTRAHATAKAYHRMPHLAKGF